MAARTGPTERRQRSTLRPAAVLLVALGTLALLACAMTVLHYYERWARPGPEVTMPAPFPAPGVQSDPAGELRAYLAAQRQELAGYGWVDREQGLVRIPIERAMALLAARDERALDPLDDRPADPGATGDGR